MTTNKVFISIGLALMLGLAYFIFVGSNVNRGASENAMDLDIDDKQQIVNSSALEEVQAYLNTQDYRCQWGDDMRYDLVWKITGLGDGQKSQCPNLDSIAEQVKNIVNSRLAKFVTRFGTKRIIKFLLLGL